MAIAVDPTQNPTPPKPSPKFSDASRWTLIVVGLVLIAVGLGLWIKPVQHSKPAPDSAKCSDAKTCWVKVDDAPEILLSSLVVLGALLLLVGVNNRQLVKFAGPGGISFESASDDAGDQAKQQAGQLATDQGLSAAEKAAAEKLAEEKAKKLTVSHESANGRRLTPFELPQLTMLAAREAVEDVKADPAIT